MVVLRLYRKKLTGSAAAAAAAAAVAAAVAAAPGVQQSQPRQRRAAPLRPCLPPRLEHLGLLPPALGLYLGGLAQWTAALPRPGTLPAEARARANIMMQKATTGAGAGAIAAPQLRRRTCKL